MAHVCSPKAAGISVQFATDFPSRTAGLVLFGGIVCGASGADYPHGHESPYFRSIEKDIEERWGSPLLVELQAPSAKDDVTFREWLATYYRMALSPRDAKAALRFVETMDLRHLLSRVDAPTLVLHRTGDKIVSADAGRWLAEQIPHARFVQLTGEDHLPYVGDTLALADQVRLFVQGLARTLAASA